MTSYHILSRLIAPYHTLSPIFHRKVMSVTSLSLIPSLLKMLSHLAKSYHALSHLLTFYPPILTEK